MKEATGELNMTVITVVAIAAVGALFTFFLWPQIQRRILLSSACSNLNSVGNYNSADSADERDNRKGTSVVCENYTCTVTYNGRTYEGYQCDQSD